MLAVFEVLSGLFLLWYSFLPSQNFELMARLSAMFAAVWLIFFVIRRSRLMISTTVFFYFCLIVTYHLRVCQPAGWLFNWYTLLALAQWTIVIWLQSSENTLGASVFLVITCISPFYWPILHTRNSSFVGFSLWVFAIVHAVWILARQDRIRIPRVLVAFLFFSLLPIPFSVYSWRALQFFWIQCACVLVYCICAFDSWPQKKQVLAAGYLFLVSSLVLYTLTNDFLIAGQIGASALGMRHHILEHANTLAPLYIIFSSLLLYLGFQSSSRYIRRAIFVLVTALAMLEFLTYSRNGWMGYALFLFSLAALSISKKQKLIAGVGVLAICFCFLLLLPSARSMAQQRILDSSSVTARILNWKMGWQSIRSHPLFGTGWFNYYTHTRLLTGPAFGNLEVHQWLGDVHNHSLFLDLAEAGGFPLLLSFIVVLYLHFKGPIQSNAVTAGLIGVTLNNILDTASLWLTVYPHFWVLLSFMKPADSLARFRLPSPRIVLLIFLLAAGAAPLVEDHYLQKSNFYHITNRDTEAVRTLRIASIAAPFDASPLELLKDVYLSRGDASAATTVLEKLTRIKKDYAPYYAELAGIALVQKDFRRAERYLLTAQHLDPYGSLRGDTFLVLADLQFQRGSTDFQVSLYRYLMSTNHPMDFRARMLMDRIDENALLDGAVRYANENTLDGADWSTAITNLHDNLLVLHKPAMAVRSLELALQQRKRLLPADADYFCYLLAQDYARSGKNQDLAKLATCSSDWAVPLIEAYANISIDNFEDAKKNLQNALQFSPYNDISTAWESFWKRKGSESDLRKYYEIEERLPSFDFNPRYREEIAESFVREKRYDRAAEQHHRLSFYAYDNPTPHWWEARMWWLSGNREKARKANDRLQRFVPSNAITKNLYLSEIEPSPGQPVRILRVGLPNDLNGLTWRTGIYAHPECRIKLPSELKLHSISGEVAMIWGAWFEQTDGVQCSIRTPQGISLFTISISPYTNQSERRWIPFQWNGTPTQVMLETSPIGDANYDWTMWVVDHAE